MEEEKQFDFPLLKKKYQDLFNKIINSRDSLHLSRSLYHNEKK